MTDHEVRGLLANEGVQAVGIPLHGGEPHVSLGGAPAGGRERVRARVHDRDIVAESGERDGEPSGSAAGVHDVERGPSGLGDARGEHLA